MEYADDGDLYQKILDHKNNHKLFEESEIWSVLIQSVIGLKQLHNMNILHRDLKVLFALFSERQYIFDQKRIS